jgi:hypothetical protein
MSKSSRDVSPAPAEHNPPPLLSDKLIAQLQGAVTAAQRKRVDASHAAPALTRIVFADER